MNSICQDIINNFIMFFFAFFIGRKQEKRNNFYLITLICFAELCIIRYLFFNVLITNIDRSVQIYFRMFGFALLLFLVVGSTIIAYKCDFWTGLFLGTLGYCIQHLCQRTYSFITGYLADGSSVLYYYLIYLGIITLIFFILYFLIKNINLYYMGVNRKSAIVISIISIFSTIVLSFLTTRYVRNSSAEFRTYYNITILLMTALIIIYELSILKTRNAEIERDNVKDILKKSEEQYNYERSIMDLINIKIHDLKHQIENIKYDEKTKISDRIKEAVETYDSIFRTNNPALDVVLTRSSFICKQKNIYYTCMVDNDCLSFLDEIDTYSLFGNILDNAIEAVDNVKDEEKRVLDIKISKKNCFVMIREENYYSGKINFFEGIPQTNKKDKNAHGYGIKSIQSIVDKYKGNLDFKTQEDRFIIDIIFPTEE